MPTTVLTLPSSVIVAKRAVRDSYVEQPVQNISEVVLHDDVINGSHAHQFVLSLLYKPDASDPSPPFPVNDGSGYPAPPLDPSKSYRITFEEL